MNFLGEFVNYFNDTDEFPTEKTKKIKLKTPEEKKRYFLCPPRQAPKTETIYEKCEKNVSRSHDSITCDNC